jgi:hypothetical protein
VPAIRPVFEVTVAVAFERQGDAVRDFQPFLPMLSSEVRRWMDEQAGQLVEERRFHHFVALAERYRDLLRSVNWVAGRFEHTPGRQPPSETFEAVLTVVAMAVAAGAAAPHAFGAGAVPVEVTEAFVALWRAGVPRRPDVTAPQVAAAFLSGAWSPEGRPRFQARWEPARLLLEAMTYKSTCHGLRRAERNRFNQRLLTATHAAAVWLTSPAGRAPGVERLEQWDSEVLNLWQFFANAILGPGRAGTDGHAQRPLPGAFDDSLLCRWAEREIGLAVGTAELYVCSSCVGFHPEPSCPARPGAAMLVTWRRHQFLTPKDFLGDDQRYLGHEQVLRKVCKHTGCVDQLHGLLARGHPAGRRFGAQPLYRTDLDECPFCHRRGTAGQRPLTVWTRFP